MHFPASYCLSVFLSQARLLRVGLLQCLDMHGAQISPKWHIVYRRVCVRVSEGSGDADLLTRVFVLLIPLF